MKRSFEKDLQGFSTITKEEPTVSLIIPAYNEEKYIGSFLESVINSGAKFLEIIVVDNASSDNTSEVAQKFPGIKVIREEQKGPTFARQRGIQESKGDLLAFSDADNRMPKGWYETVIKEFQNDPKLVSLSGPYAFYDFPPFLRFFEKMYYYVAYLLYLMVGYMVIAGNFVIRRDTLEKMGGLDTSILFYGDDTNIARRAHKFGKVKFKLNFVMNSSARRLKGPTAFKTLSLYFLAYLSEIFIHKPITKKYTDVR